MDLANNLETIRQSCRVCLQKGDINIWDFKVKFTPDETNYIRIENMKASECSNEDENVEKCITTLELLEIFNKSTDSLVLPDEFPLLCWQCLEDFRLCYIFQEKVRNSSMRLKLLYEECLNQCIEEEHLLENEGDSTVNVNDIKINDVFKLEDMDQLNLDNCTDIATQHTDILPEKSVDIHQKHRRTLDKNSSIVVTQYVPSAMVEHPTKLFNTLNPTDAEELQPPRNLHTVDCTTVEIKDINQLESLETSCLVIIDNDGNDTTPPVFVCQYCPQAFAKSEFLKTHIQKNHICKFCMQTFHHYIDLCIHLREHKEHKCVICHRMLSSQTNLRHHIKRIHRINLPPKMTLLDFIQYKDVEDEKDDHITDIMPNVLMNETSNREADVELHDDNYPLEDIIYVSKVVNADGLIETNIMEIN